MSWWQRLWSRSSTQAARNLEPLIKRINELEAVTAALPNEALPQKTQEFKDRLKADQTLDDLLPEAYALVREAAKRTLGQRHYDVQLIGGIFLHQRSIIEMKTGEGKTLVSTLPVYLNALTGDGVHVITVNDYLARRDTVWMGQIYALLGLSVGVINHDTAYLYDAGHRETDTLRDTQGSFRIFYEFLKPCQRREAYAADITYGTNSEFGFDYLRDHLAQAVDQVVQRSSHHFAIIDEVDSILIDEARTPLIISAPIGQSESWYARFAKVAATLQPVDDYTIEEKTKSIALTENGITKAERALGVDNLYTAQGLKLVYHLETAVRAKALFARDRDYVVKPASPAGGDNQIIIVDEFTGRLQPGRRWSEGLHQAIEAKEGVMVQQESRTLASISYQNYFRLYHKLSGMTGTALTSAEEFRRVYGLETLEVPTHKPSQRQDLNDLIFQTERGKFTAIARQVKELHTKGQPVLVGTVSIEKNELISQAFKTAGIPHRLLNAKNNEEEGAIIAEAGRRGSVVVATNLAGRGVDIKLGGPAASPEEVAAVRSLGGLFVLGTERHEARRIDNQLRGRSGRQGDPGVTQFFISLEDSLSRVFAADTVKRLMGRLGIPEDEPISARLVSRAIENAQAKIEGLNFDVRKHLLEYDNVLNQQRSTFYERRNKILFAEPGALEEFFKLLGVEISVSPEQQTMARQTVLQLIDLHWLDHLEDMEYLRHSVRLRAYGQRDPVIEYKREGLRLFKAMEQRLAEAITDTLKRLSSNPATTSPAFNPEVLGLKSQTPLTVGKTGLPRLGEAGQGKTGLPRLDKTGRNDPCPCGSGKKYKKCHGQ